MSTSQTTSQPVFNIRTILGKNLSIQSELMPYEVQSDWSPEVDIFVDYKIRELETDVHEVLLMLKATVKNQGNPIFEVASERVGVFEVKDFDSKDQEGVLNINAPMILFPYVRQDISDLISRTGFPPLYLRPIDFVAFYESRKESVVSH